ncbi:MAG TPA: F0F1 ATP synthase subunit delta [Verrucomicrobiae bacterium]|jgi:F-type H+-transporting ATPase subunit delta|nr:F0F1 ATP synthase subunit delta [Verrucomicrobiae bacterium]
MKAGKQTRREAKQLFRSTFVNGTMDDAKIRLAVKAIIEKKPRGYVAILEHLKRLVKLEQDRRTARIESAVPLSAEQQAGVTSNLERIYGQGLNLSFEQNPSLLGGLRVRVGSDVYDGTVASRLQELEEAF